jgi:quinol monooxygenase YgiN
VTYLVIAHLRAKAGEEERVAEGLRINEAASRQEPGVLEWIAYRSTSDPRAFVLYEVYRTEADFAAHRETAHFARYVAEVVPLLEVREVSTWEPLS